MSYGCNKCNNWDYSNDGFYYVENGEIHDCTVYDDITLRRKPNPPPGKKAYPIYSNKTFSMWASMEFGGSPYDWDETHCCPHCNEEFDISNSNY